MAKSVSPPGTSSDISVSFEHSDSRARKAWYLRRRGEHISVIAAKLDISPEWAGKLIKGYVEQLASELSESRALDLLASELAELTEQIGRNEKLLGALLNKFTENERGEREYGQRQTQAIQAQERLIRQLKKDRTDLLLEVGLIPRAPDRHLMVQALSAELNLTEDHDSTTQMSTDELKEEIIKILQKTRRIQ